MTLDPLAFAFDLEVEAANRKCPNCGKVGMTLGNAATSVTRFTESSCDCYVECHCLRCEAISKQHFTFEKPRFVY